MSKPLMVSPHAASYTRDSDVTDTPYPVVTRSLLADHEKLEAHHTPEQINQPLFALIKARKALSDAHIACNCAKRKSESYAVTSRLNQIMAMLRSLHEEFPLTILENAPNRPRKHIMAGQDTVARPTPWGVE